MDDVREDTKKSFFKSSTEQLTALFKRLGVSKNPEPLSPSTPTASDDGKKKKVFIIKRKTALDEKGIPITGLGKLKG